MVKTAETISTDLAAMTLEKLVEHYNSIVPESSHVKSFRDKTTAIARVTAAMRHKASEEGASAKKAKKEKAPKAPRAKRAEGEAGTGEPRRKRFVLPPKGEIKKHREETKRAKVVEMLGTGKGATFEQVMEATGWDRRTAYEGIKLVHAHLGYGLQEDEDTGLIKLVLPK